MKQLLPFWEWNQRAIHQSMNCLNQAINLIICILISNKFCVSVGKISEGSVEPFYSNKVFYGLSFSSKLKAPVLKSCYRTTCDELHFPMHSTNLRESTILWITCSMSGSRPNPSDGIVYTVGYIELFFQERCPPRGFGESSGSPPVGLPFNLKSLYCSLFDHCWSKLMNEFGDCFLLRPNWYSLAVICFHTEWLTGNRRF